eukprot:SAG31_NODE_4010_length_3667_cov_2.004484_2_plen_114_part_00
MRLQLQPRARRAAVLRPSIAALPRIVVSLSAAAAAAALPGLVAAAASCATEHRGGRSRQEAGSEIIVYAYTALFITKCGAVPTAVRATWTGTKFTYLFKQYLGTCNIIIQLYM